MNDSQVDLVASPPRPVDVDALERELARLWSESDSTTGDDSTVTRACMSNLVVYCATEALAADLPAELAVVAQSHPARVLLLVGEAPAPPLEIEAYVSALCHGVGAGKQVCSEHVKIAAGPQSTQRLAAAARSLLIGDLPTSLWWVSPQAPPLGGAIFDELSPMCQQVIYESVGWAEPARGVVATSTWANRPGGRQFIADLGWQRLRPWRRLIGQSLDDRVAPGALANLDLVEIDHGPHGLPQAWLLVGWLASTLGWQPSGGKVAAGREIAWQFSTPRQTVRAVARRAAEGEPQVTQVRVCWSLPTGPASLSVAVAGADRLEVSYEGLAFSPRAHLAPGVKRAALVAAQLSELVRDPQFQCALEVGRSMAETLLP